ncbi:MAG: ImmA/IrrE family metallo-endopeptidase [Candidatus Omnitrophica bacterium]|nr:ImmA/IrrE family metallo-endopeptidase [Candidatus Omnitrophota bacterium]
MRYKIKFLTRKEIQEISNNFLLKFHPTLELPIPIEEIIEFKLGMDIIPVPGLKAAAEKMELNIDAFYSHLDDSISVDNFIYSKRETRYRLTLAHELGHKFLHEYVYRKAQFNLMSKYVNFINNFPIEEREKAEWQAYEFAGRILIPQQALVSKFNAAIETVQKETEISYKDNHAKVEDMAIKYYLQEAFNVSEIPIRIRLETEGIIEKRRLGET